MSDTKPHKTSTKKHPASTNSATVGHDVLELIAAKSFCFETVQGFKSITQAVNGIHAAKKTLAAIFEAEFEGNDEFPLNSGFVKGCILDSVESHLFSIHGKIDRLTEQAERCRELFERLLSQKIGKDKEYVFMMESTPSGVEP